MAVVTPGGLQIRMDPREVFALVTVLRSGSQRVEVLRVLRLCDAIEGLPGITSYLAGMIALAWTGNPWVTAAALVFGPAVGWIVRPVLVHVPITITLANLWESYFRFIIRQPLAVVVALVFSGWLTAVLWPVGSAVAAVVGIIVATMQQSPAVSYVRACRLVGRQTGTLALLSDERIRESVDNGAWEHCWREYAEQMPPQAVRIVASDLSLALSYAAS